jgi:hypothetical protein
MQLEREDALPKSVCKTCVRKLDDYHSFREACVQAEVALESNLKEQQPSVFPLEPEVHEIVIKITCTSLDWCKCFGGICFPSSQWKSNSSVEKMVPVKQAVLNSKLCHIPKDSILNSHCSENLRFHSVLYIVCDLHISLIDFNLVLYQIFGSLHGNHILGEPALRKNYYKICLSF